MSLLPLTIQYVHCSGSAGALAVDDRRRSAKAALAMNRRSAKATLAMNRRSAETGCHG
jgi:hypothetical protein